MQVKRSMLLGTVFFLATSAANAALVSVGELSYADSTNWATKGLVTLGGVTSGVNWTVSGENQTVAWDYSGDGGQGNLGATTAEWPSAGNYTTLGYTIDNANINLGPSIATLAGSSNLRISMVAPSAGYYSLNGSSTLYASGTGKVLQWLDTTPVSGTAYRFTSTAKITDTSLYASGPIGLSAPAGATVRSAGSSTINNVVTTNLDGYIFYKDGSTGDVKKDTSYVSISTSGDSFYPGNDSYTTLSLDGGTPFTTGIAYQYCGEGNTATLATLTLQGNVPTAFRVGVLTNNTDNDLNLASAVIVSGSNSITTTTALRHGSNDFYYFDILGGHTGDLITIALTQSGGAAVPLGGLTFQTIPEPSAMVLLSAGLISLLAYAWRKRK